MTLKLSAVVLVVYLAMAAFDLPALWRSPERAGERWAVISLLLIGMVLAVVVVLEYMPFSAYRLIGAIFKPIGMVLFKIKEG